MGGEAEIFFDLLFLRYDDRLFTEHSATVLWLVTFLLSIRICRSDKIRRWLMVYEHHLTIFILMLVTATIIFYIKK